MTTEKTEMQFPYSPPDFFEAEYSRQTDEYILVADSGVVRITLCVSSDPIDANDLCLVRISHRLLKVKIPSSISRAA